VCWMWCIMDLYFDSFLYNEAKDLLTKDNDHKNNSNWDKNKGMQNHIGLLNKLNSSQSGFYISYINLNLHHITICD